VKLAIKYLMSFLLDGSTHQGETDSVETSGTTNWTWQCRQTRWNIRDFKLSPCSECRILSFGCIRGIWILCTDVSEHSVPSSQVV